jgi:hypothetical protein
MLRRRSDYYVSEGNFNNVSLSNRLCRYVSSKNLTIVAGWENARKNKHFVTFSNRVREKTVRDNELCEK